MLREVLRLLTPLSLHLHANEGDTNREHASAPAPRDWPSPQLPASQRTIPNYPRACLPSWPYVFLATHTHMFFITPPSPPSNKLPSTTLTCRAQSCSLSCRPMATRFGVQTPGVPLSDEDMTDLRDLLDVQA